MPSAPAAQTTPPSADVPAAATVLYHADPVLLRGLLSALATNGRRIYVFVNGPASAPVEEVLAETANVRALRVPANIGLGAALNEVVNAARDDGATHIVLFDQDSTPPADLPEALLTRFRALERQGHRMAAVGPHLAPPVGSGYLPIRYWWRRPRGADPAGAVEFLPTSGTLLSMAAWDAVGPFRADYFIGGIDVEWGYRAWHHGFASAVVRDVEMVHRWGEEGGGKVVVSQITRQGAGRLYFYYRNAAHGLGMPHMPWRWKWRQAVRMVAQSGVIMTARSRRDVSLRFLARAVADGLHGRLGPLPSDIELK